MGTKLTKNENTKYENIKYEDCIPFVPPLTEGIVVKVYDGDTITIASKMPWKDSPYYRFSVRINGIDCPEIRTQNENEKKCAFIARDLLQTKLMNNIVTLKNVSLEKYGRILADVFIGEEDISNMLLNENLAVVYHGGKKQCPHDWYEYYLLKNNQSNENN